MELGKIVSIAVEGVTLSHPLNKNYGSLSNPTINETFVCFFRRQFLL